MPTRPLLSLLVLCILGSLALPSRGQSAPPPEAPPTLTLHAESRIVLTDVTVTDRNGNPVHNLPASAFHIFDDNQPQRLASFDERIDASFTATPPRPAATGVYSNAFFQHLPPVLNVLMLDTTNLELPDQMYLSFQLTKFVNALPAGQPIAIFERHGDNTVLLQNFTADHALLLAAVRKALPRILLTGREYRTDTDTLHQLAVALSQIPGRKNVLWFSGGSTSFLLSGLNDLSALNPTAPTSAGTTANSPVGGLTSTFSEDIDAFRQVYDELEAARIAIYPIDARGLTVEGDAAMKYQQAQMNDTAEATGGEAFFNMNGLAQIASHVLSTDSSAYTLTYSPADFHYDNKWHTVRITLKGPYHLSYRRGYFADKPATVAPSSAGPAASLLANGSTPAAPPDIRSSPILFQADAHPAADTPVQSEFVPLRAAAPPQKGTTTIDVDYSLSTAALTPVSVDGTPRATLAFAVIAFDSDGNRVAQSLDRVRFPLQPDGPPKLLKVQQQIDLHKGGGFLSLVVWDTGSGRIGTLQIPVQVSSPSKSR